ncbi:MAG: GGDEF domain-containing protein, partial [Spirochaetales bacterium]|nr:GGDEF domain-containing protein [Spirochaetales bacterium]
MFDITHLSLKNQITVLILFLISALSIISTFTISVVLILGLFISCISIYMVLNEIYPNKNKSITSILLTLILVYLLIRHPNYPIFNIFYTLSIYLLINYNFNGVIKNIFLGTILLLLTFSVSNLSPTIYISIPLIFIFFSFSIFISHKYEQNQKEINYLKEKKLEESSIRDHLTGLYNRKFMEQKIITMHSIWKRGIQAYSLIMVDVDYFKKYNDYYGHIQGDICLKTISSILQKQINRETDYAFRYGGEEFLLMLG